MRQLPKQVSAATATQVMARDGWRCRYCDVALTPSNYSIDHFRPRTKEGGDAIENLFAACRSCNTTKGSRVFASVSAVRVMVEATIGVPPTTEANPFTIEARKRSGKPSKEAKAAQMRRYRARHRSQSRAYMRRYMAARRARAGRGADPAAGDL